MIAKWKCLKSKAMKIKQLFLRCLGKVYQIDNFNELHDFIKLILVIPLSEDENAQTRMIFYYNLKYTFRINSATKGTMIDKQAKEHDDYDEIIAGDWAKNVHASPRILPSNNGNIVNTYYNIETALNI